ncbi:MAG: citrate lyase holo-[acyl-carrier protein] synthase [Clostridiales bacterium]|jgi:holo-ACP synthase/triphosphoribosyl-dephospho-CoA synthase|nr:citrate lyase holo-[acyl-carrier protein] synthase [Clostridiales bacterium]
MPVDFFAGSKPVTLEEVLSARENRAALQREIIENYKTSLICFTMNIPGEYKRFPLQEKAFGEGFSMILRRLEGIGAEVVYKAEICENTGYEGFFAVKANAARLKRLALMIEDRHPLGRLFDIDIFDENGTRLSGSDYGRPARACIICGKPVWECGRARKHPADELALKTAEIMRDYFDDTFADWVGGLAQKALLYEAAATPKPGLVDRENSGAHSDMDFFMFLDSVSVLGPFFRRCAMKGINYSKTPETLLDALRLMGMTAEDDMLRATNGVNTHKGAVYSLGILSAAAGCLYSMDEEMTAEKLSDLCAAIAGKEAGTPQTETPGSHGGAVYKQYGLSGIRGEAASGFKSALNHGLPALCAAWDKGLGPNEACVIALLNLLGVSDDTNIVYRAGLETLRELQTRVSEMLSSNPQPEELMDYAKSLDAELINRGISPGGGADLLAVSLMLSFLTNGNN